MFRIFLVAIALMKLTGCASFSSDGGFGAVENSARTTLQKDIVWAKASADQELIRARVKSLLAGELSVDAAVQVALLNNPGLQATYYELGLAEAKLVQAGRLRNPGFTFSRLERHGEVEIERQFMFDLLGLLTMPTRTRIETRRFEQAKLRVSSEVMRVAADTRRAWYAAVAAQQHAVYMSEVKEAAEAGAELAQNMVRAGNISKLNQSREQVFYAEVMAQYARAQQQDVGRVG
jgi:outer membrane protein TolC